MNPGGFMTPSVNTLFSSPSSNDGSERSAMFQSPRSSLPSTPPHSRVPVTRYPAGSPFFTPGPPRSMPHQPVLSSLPPLSTSWSSSLLPKSPSPPSSRRTSVPSKTRRPPPPSFRHGPVTVGNPSPSSSGCHSFTPSSTPAVVPSWSGPVENRGSSIGFEQQPSFPPPTPFRDSNPVTVPGNTLPPRKAHKRSNTDHITGVNSMIPQNNPESVYPDPSQQFLGDSSCGNEGDGAPKSDGKDKGKLYYEFLNVSDVNFENGDDNDVMIDISEYEDTSNIANETRSTTTSGVKRRAGKDIDDSSRHYRSVSTDSYFKPPPSSGYDLPRQFSSIRKNAPTVKITDEEYTESELEKIANSAKLSEIASDKKKVRRILGNRLAAARSKERKTRELVTLRHRVHRLTYDNTSLSNKLAEMEAENKLLKNGTKELIFRVQSLEKQAKLRDALNEQLTGKIRRLRLTNEMILNRGEFDRSNMQSPVDPNMFQQRLNTNQYRDFLGQNQGS